MLEMTRKQKTLLLFLVIGLGLQSQERFEYRHRQMGTQIRLVFYTSDQGKADSVSKAVFARIDGLNNKLSDYIEESELNTLCKQAQQDVSVSEDLYLVLKEAVRISKKTEGAFDVSAGPLVQLWRKARDTKALPSNTEITTAKQRVGNKYITFPQKNTVRLEKPGMQLDLGGIAKGFAADEAIKILESHKIGSALIDMGGDIRVSNPPPNKPYWTLAFSYFNREGNEIVRKIRLKNQAVATSGDLYQSVSIDGVRYSHIIDTRTGYALSNSTQVTVISKSGLLADAHASAVSVMGIQRSIVFLNEVANLKIFMVSRSKDGYTQWNSPNFNVFLVE